MKKMYLLVSLLVTFSFAMAQTEQRFAGTWEGKLNVGVVLRVVIHLKPLANGGMAAILDSPDQGTFGLVADTVTVFTENLQVKINRINAAYTGKLINDSTIHGVFTQGADLPLQLKKVDTVYGVKRPQTPQPPFSYKAEDVEYNSADGSLHYSGTLTVPFGNGPFPAALLITGSGPQDRNETLMGHQLFGVLADALTKNGFAVLRVDDRGIGKSTGIFSKATSADFANDVNTSFDYLLGRPEINKKKAGLIGHSEGGMIAPMVAANRKDIHFVVLLAAPGIKISELMKEQAKAVILSAGVSPSAADQYMRFYSSLMNIALTASDSTTARTAASSALQQWLLSADSLTLKEMGLDNAKNQQDVTSNLVQQFSTPWFKYFLAFDPQPYLQKMKTKVLAVNGDKDIQVIAASNLAGIEASLKKGKTKKYTIKSLPNLNHLFQQCTTCTLGEYGELEETFSPAALNEINDWLNKNVK